MWINNNISIKKLNNAQPFNDNDKTSNFFVKNTEPGNLKREGETCGFSRSEVCGVCEDGLQCLGVMGLQIMDACGHCMKKRGNVKMLKSCHSF